jgi:hypothetical protein
VKEEVMVLLEQEVDGWLKTRLIVSIMLVIHLIAILHIMLPVEGHKPLKEDMSEMRVVV